MRYLIIICLTVFSFTSKAQDITGTWVEQDEDRFTSYTKLCIVNICGKYVGFTYDKDKKDGNCTADFSGVYNKKRRTLRGETINFIGAHTYGHVLAIYDLSYKKEGQEEVLEGLVYQKPDSVYQMINGIPRLVIIEDLQPETIRLKRKSAAVADSTAYMKRLAAKPCKIDAPVVTITPEIISPVQEKPAEQKIIEKPVSDTPVAISPRDHILQLKTQRINDTVSIVSVEDRELTVRVMDNAITDGDTISILHNGNLIADRIPVTAKAYPIKFSLSKEDPYHELTLIAHNLGSIPPNTALVIVSSGGREYKLYAYADLKKNAVIIFRYVGP